MKKIDLFDALSQKGYTMDKDVILSIAREALYVLYQKASNDDEYLNDCERIINELELTKDDLGGYENE